MKIIHKKLFDLREVTGKVLKNKENKFLKNSYADLNSVMEATDQMIHDAGLLWLDRVEGMSLITQVIDMDSGEFIENKTPLLVLKDDMQQLGSAITYSRRFARLTILSLDVADDDAALASGQSFAKPKQIKEITELLLSTKTDSQKFLSHYRVSSVKEMYELSASDAINTLKLKLSKMTLNKKGDENGTA